jgi:deazaflavin-dependent oxidoreductase (nitroreductase family)
MRVPRFMRRVNRLVTNPIIHHVGRKSGRRYRTPVLAFPSRNGFVIPMPYGKDVEWARNILAAKECELIQTGRRSRLGNPRIVGFKAAESHLPVLARGALRTANLPGYLLLTRESDRSRATKGRRSRS